MKLSTTTNLLLGLIALLLSVLVLRPYCAPSPVHAQQPNDALYIEPGTYLMRSPDNTQQSYGKVVIDLRNGQIWGFPTYYAGQPFPTDPVTNKATTAHPYQLGRFALEDIKK